MFCEAGMEWTSRFADVNLAHLVHSWSILGPRFHLTFNLFGIAVAIKISNLHICFYSFDLSCPILEKNIFIESVYIVLSCLNK